MSDTKVKVTYYELPNYTPKEDSDVRRIELRYKSDQVMIFHIETFTKYPQAIAYHARGFFYNSESSSSYVKIDVNDSFLDCTLQGTANCDCSEPDSPTVIFQHTRYGGHLIFFKDMFTTDQFSNTEILFEGDD